MALFDGTLTLSANLDYFQNRGAYYVYHNLFGYILEMSRDLLDFLEFFRGKERTGDDVEAEWGDTFAVDELMNFTHVFELQSCLTPDGGASEEAKALRMVPVFARSVVFHQPEEGQIKLYLAPRDSDTVEVIELDAWDAAFWRLIDQERTLGDIVEAMRGHEDSPTSGLEQKALATLFKFTHSDAQFLKLSPKPLEELQGGQNTRGLPPYLRSTMPYARITDEVRGEDGAARVALDGDDSEVSDQGQEQDRYEMTFARLFRDPHEVLGGRSYGGAVAHRLLNEGKIKAGAKIAELGPFDGSFTKGFLDHVHAHNAALYGTLAYTIAVEDAAIADDVKATLSAAGHEQVKVEVLPLGEIHKDQDVLGGPFDLILCNEAIARLETVLLRKITIGDEEEDEAEEAAEGEEGDEKPAKNGNGHGKGARDMYLGEGDSVNVIFRHNLTFHDVDGEFFFNVGAVRLIEWGAKRLAEGGSLFLVEFGDLFTYPEPSDASTEDNLQFSIHFLTLQNVGKSVGLEPAFEWLAAWLEDVNRSAQMLMTNRTHFRALRHMLEEHGVKVDTRAYTRGEFEGLLEGQVDLDEVFRLEYKSFNDRVMGLVTSSLKVLELVKPAPEPEVVVEM